MARMLRDWTSSEKVHTLSAEAERFFTRLIMKADDYGRYFGNVKLLKAYLFPLHVKLKDEKVESWLNECVKADLILHYEVEGKPFVEIKFFDQKLKVRRSKYPPSNEQDRLDIREGYVYLIGVDYTQPVKIGFSANPWSRLKEISCNHPEKLDVLLAIKGEKQFESMLHKHLKGLRVKNEWFQLDPEVVDLLISYSKGEMERELLLQTLSSNSYELRSSPEKEVEEEVEIETKKKRKVEFKPPSAEEMVSFFNEHGYDGGEIAYLHYSDNDWKNKYGKPVLNWKSTVMKNWFKPDAKKKESAKSQFSQENNQW